MNIEIFYENERRRVAKNFSKSKHKGFEDKEDLANWFVDELKKDNSQCHYCETTINLII